LTQPHKRLSRRLAASYSSGSIAAAGTLRSFRALARQRTQASGRSDNGGTWGHGGARRNRV